MVVVLCLEPEKAGIRLDPWGEVPGLSYNASISWRMKAKESAEMWPQKSL